MALAPGGEEAEARNKICQLIRHLWHISGSLASSLSIFLSHSLSFTPFFSLFYLSLLRDFFFLQHVAEEMVHVVM